MAVRIPEETAETTVSISDRMPDIDGMPDTDGMSDTDESPDTDKTSDAGSNVGTITRVGA